MTEPIKDTRWLQRFSNFNKALDKLNAAINYIQRVPGGDKVLEGIIEEGLIQRFEYTHELAWNVMKDYLLEAGNVKVIGSKDATREAFQAELIPDGDIWMEMIKSRNITSHTYNEDTAREIYTKILNQYHAAFLAFRKVMEGKALN